MSSASRTTTRGVKGGKPETTVGGKSQKSDAKSDSPKALDLNPKIQPTAEQMRIAQIIDTRTEDPDLKDKIKQVMDATRKTEDEVCTALHDCDNDPDRAVNMLLEGMGTGEWEMSGKKKKNRQPGTNAKPEGPVNNREDPGGDWSREREGGGGSSGGVERERSRVRGGGPPRMRGRSSLDSRGWRGRENKENEKNLEDSRGDIPRRGGRMMNGPGGRSGRGGRGGRLGPRTFQNRERGGFPRSIDTWNNPQAEDSTADPIKMGQLGVSMTHNSLLENWADDFPSPEDWDNEEYTGSLADTKVFTPSNSVQQASLNPEPLQDSTNQDIASPVPQNISSSLSPNSDQMSQNLDLASTLQQNNQTPTVTPNTVGVGVMTPAQSQYLSQLTQATESLKSAVGIGSNSTPVSNSSQTYGPVSTSTNNYPVTSSAAYHTPSPTAFTSTTDALSASFSTSSFGGSAASYSSQMKVQASVPPPVSQSSVTQSMPARTKTQRPRVPPPSKIPSTAVEMPGDAINSSISFLDVQFGGLEFGSETSSFDFSTDQSKFSGAATGTSMDSVSNSGTSSAIDLNASNTSKSQSTSLDGYSGSSSQQSSKDHNQSGMSLGQNQKLSGPENIQFPSNQNAEHKTSQPAFSQPRVSGSGSSGMDIGKSDAGLSYSASSTVTYQNSYQNQKASATVYQAPSSYSTSSGYTSSQVQSSSTPYPSSQAQSSFSQSQSNSGYASQATNSSYPSSQASNSTSSYSSAQSVVGGNAVSGSAGASGSGTGSGSYASDQSSVSSSSSYQTSGGQAVPAPPVPSSTVATSSAYQGAGSTASTPSAPSGPPSSFPSSMSQSASANSSYPSQSTYQSAGQSGYANSSSLGQLSGSSGGYTSSSAGQYQNSYGSSSVATSQSHSALHTSGTGGSKIGSSLNSASKEPQFETTTTSSSNLSSTIPATTSSALSTNVNVSPALGLPTSSQTVNVSNSSSTKVSSSTGKTGGLPNIPPGVPPIMGTHQYIMSQAGLPYFAGVQQPVFSYEDLQLLQQRIPHMQAAGYYDLGYQAPTSLATGREAGLASVAYSVSDGRFARTDNNSSPVPSTLSQQNPSQAHQQPMLNPTALPPGYAYFYGGGMVPAGGFQYGTPAIYPMATATNAHGATNNTQYPKPGSYASAYGSGYDNLSQNQEYGKTGYVSGNQSQSKGGVGVNTGTAGSSASDLSGTMYGKSHALGKVNSYDKQGFHSGTPPPFNMAGTQTTPMGAPSGAYPPHLFIPTMHQQHHSTTLMHQPLHTMEMRNPGRRSESGSTSGQRSQSSNQPNKSGGKQGYSASYWANN